MMQVCCDLEVDVNGEEIFMVDQKIVASYSGRLRKLFVRSKGGLRNLKVIFHDFPGGPESFELILKFCYGNGKTEISPSNVALLHSAADFMEMNSSVLGNLNLLEQLDKFIKDIIFWTWSDLLICLKQTQDRINKSHSSIIFQQCIDTLIVRMSLGTESSPCRSSSPESSVVRLSCDTKSTESLKTSFSRATWWFEDLLFLNPESVRIVTNSMVVRKFDQAFVSKFLIHYQKSKLLTANSAEKVKVMEVVIDVLCTLEKSTVSSKSLFEILRVVLSLNLNKSSRSKLETMIGLRLDEAALDNLLIPSPNGTNCLYDVNLVLRFLRAFTSGGTLQALPLQLKRVGSLVDLYMAEVAPDPCLKPSKFIALAMALPDSARDSCDQMYISIDIYLRVHSGLKKEEKTKICCVLNYDKLSTDACLRLLKNPKFLSRPSIQALIAQQSKLQSLLPGSENDESFEGADEAKQDKGKEQFVVYAGKLEMPAGDKRPATRPGGFQWRVEKFGRKMQTQMEKNLNSSVSYSDHGHGRPLPWLCS